jgi:hypothetical protein
MQGVSDVKASENDGAFLKAAIAGLRGRRASDSHSLEKLPQLQIVMIDATQVLH